MLQRQRIRRDMQGECMHSWEPTCLRAYFSLRFAALRMTRTYSNITNTLAIITTINRIVIIATINRIAIIATINRIAIIATINRIAIITTRT